MKKTYQNYLLDEAPVIKTFLNNLTIPICMSKKRETIIVLSAHSDDFVLGAGGTIANYTKERKKVIAIVFSYGENSHPWLKEKVVQKMRSDETFEASKILHCKTYFFDCRELHFTEDYHQKNIEQKMIQLITKEKPTKIFTHSHEDPHPDHKAVHNITLNLLEKLPSSNQPEVYMYSIWNPVSFRTKYPALYNNISTTFKTKMEALKTFRSQRIIISYPLLILIWRNFFEGFKTRSRFAEKFFRIK